MRGHFWSLGKDDGHIIPNAIVENPVQTSRLYVLQNQSYCQSKFHILGMATCQLLSIS